MFNQSSYTPGQCTWGVAGWNSWIPAGLGNAAQWLMNAPAKGLRTGQIPEVGAVAVFEPGAAGLNIGPDGHVADVVAVNGDNVTVKDMNWNYEPFVTTTHSVSAASIAGYVYPPGQAPANASIAAGTLTSWDTGTLTGWSFGPFNQDTPGIGGLGDAIQAIGGVPGDILGAIGGFIGGIITDMVKAGEVLLGTAIMFAGIWVLVKHSETGQNVINIAKSTAKTGATVAGAVA